MLSRCQRVLSKHTLSKAGSWQRPQPRVVLLTKHRLYHEAPENVPSNGSGSTKPSKSSSARQLASLSPLISSLKVPRGRLRSKPPFEPLSAYYFFADLSRLLAHEEVSGTTLWLFVRSASIQVSLSTNRYPFTGHNLSDWQRSLLSQVLHKILDQWATEGVTSATVQPLTVLRHYVMFKFMRPVDWVHCLGILAKTAYQHMNLHKGQPLETALASRIGDAIRLRILCNAWRLFLMGDSQRDSDAESSASSYENLWPQLQNVFASVQNAEDGDDFIKHFISGIHELYNTGDPNLDRQLAYSSILTLVAIYQNLRVSFADNIDAPKGKARNSFQGDFSISGEGSPKLLPNWHLGPGQSVYWTPEIGHLSISEASILSTTACAAEKAILNLTLLRVVLSQMSLPEGDVQEIARIYQGFKLAVPAILAQLQTFIYDRDVYEAGLLRRHPLRAYLKSVTASNDVHALDYAGSVARSFSGVIKTAPGDALDLVRACLQMNCPERAIRYWNILAGTDGLRVHTWQVWLDYAFKQGDHTAFEIVWVKLSAMRVRRSSKMWYQRLLLLHQNNEPLAAWNRFCTLVRFSGKNRKLPGIWERHFAPANLDNAIFHMMIRSYLEKTTSTVLGMVKAEETLELMKQQDGVEVTRETYLLFVQHFLKINARQLAVDWFLNGISANIRYSFSDYALLFEYDLITHNDNKHQHLANPFANIRQCFYIISKTIGLIRRSRLYIGSDYQFSGWRLESVLKEMPRVDTVVDDPKDPRMKQIQTIYAGIMEHLARNFAEQAYDASKLARLRLLLLLWDHCVIIRIPPSTKMESVLRSTVYSLPPDLQERLLRGAMFKNYNVQDPVSFYSYRFLRIIGPQWFADRVSSIPPGPIKSRLSTIHWNGYNAINDKTLTDVGISSPEDRRNILDEITTWKNEAVEKREARALEKEVRKRQLAERAAQSKHRAERYMDMMRQLMLQERQQSNEIKDKERALKHLLETASKRRSRFQAAAKRLVAGRSTMLLRNMAYKRVVTYSPKRHLRSRPQSLRQSPAGQYNVYTKNFRDRYDRTRQRSLRGSKAMRARLLSIRKQQQAVRRRFWRIRKHATSRVERDTKSCGDRLGQLYLHGISATTWNYKVR